MKSWTLVSLGALAGSAVTVAASYAYLHRLTNFSNDMQYISAAAHVVAYHDTIQEIDGGAIQSARRRVDVLLKGSEGVMSQYEAQLKSDQRDAPNPKVVKEAKQRLDLYRAETRSL